LEKRVAGEGSGEERREGGADADDIMEIGGWDLLGIFEGWDRCP
jgi:hypothetical protein